MNGTEKAVLGVVLIGAGFIGVRIIMSALKGRANRAQDRASHAQRLKAAKDVLAYIKYNNSVPIVQSAVLLKQGERAYYSAPATLLETRAVRSYQSGSVGVRLMKGVYVGGSSGRSQSHDEWKLIDTGTLTVTNNRLIFDGAGADRTVALGKVVSLNNGSDYVEVSVDGRQKSMVFMVDNGMILLLILRLCCQVNDPSDLSGYDLNIRFDE